VVGIGPGLGLAVDCPSVEDRLRVKTPMTLSKRIDGTPIAST
jgi:hypothetical protein